jgi:hypothetical protein
MQQASEVNPSVFHRLKKEIEKQCPLVRKVTRVLSDGRYHFIEGIGKTLGMPVISCRIASVYVNNIDTLPHGITPMLEVV